MIPGAPDTYTDENGKVRVYTIADRLDDEDPEWRIDFSNAFFNWLKKRMGDVEDTDDRR